MTRNIDQLNFDPAGENPEDAYIAGIDAERQRQREGEGAEDTHSEQAEASQQPEEDLESEEAYPNAYKPSNRDTKIDAGGVEAKKNPDSRSKAKNSKKK